MSKTKPVDEQPQNVKIFTRAFLIVSLLMIVAQIINYIITLLPVAQDAVLDLGGTTTTIAALQNPYLTLLIIVVLVYGLTRFWVRREKTGPAG